jgi:hypothetical protein
MYTYLDAHFFEDFAVFPRILYTVNLQIILENKAFYNFSADPKYLIFYLIHNSHYTYFPVQQANTIISTGNQFGKLRFSLVYIRK